MRRAGFGSLLGSGFSLRLKIGSAEDDADSLGKNSGPEVHTCNVRHTLSHVSQKRRDMGHPTFYDLSKSTYFTARMKSASSP